MFKKIIFRILVFQLFTVVSSSAFSEKFTGKLDVSRQAYEGHAYDVYKVKPALGKLNILPDSEGSYVDLVLMSPDESFVKSGSYYSRKIVTDIQDNTNKEWLLLVSKYSKKKEPVEYSLDIDGADSVSLVSPDKVKELNIMPLFVARNVVSDEQKFKDQISLLKDQLQLESYREMAKRKVSGRTLPDARELSLKQEYQEIEENIKELRGALEKYKEQDNPNKLVMDLIVSEIRGSEEKLESKSKKITAFVSKREANRQLYSYLKTLDQTHEKISKLREVIAKTEGDVSNMQALEKELAELEASYSNQIETLARKLLENSKYDYLTAIFNWADPYAFSNEHYLMADFDRGFARESIVGELLEFKKHSMAIEQSYSLSALSHSGSAVGYISSYETSNFREESIGLGSNHQAWLPYLFPWPPPEASSKIVLSKNLIRGWEEDVQTLGEVDNLLVQALENNHYSGSSYFAVDEGFALVTQLEQTDAEGIPLEEKARWSTKIQEMKSFTLKEYVKALLTSPAGHYRVLCFIATSKPFSNSGDRANFKTIERWSRTGANKLPAEIRNMAYTENHDVTVLVYEFTKKKDDEIPDTSVPGRHNAIAHLESSKILASLEH